MLYHCGICVATRDISPGEELTVDYKYLLAENDAFAFPDGKTGRRVDGISSKEAFIQSAEALIALMKVEA